MFFRLKVSLAAVKRDTLSTRALMARARPCSFGTKARIDDSFPADVDAVEDRCPASPSWGTQRGETKALASISPTPVSERASI